MTIKHCYNLMYYTPKLWERFVLSFCTMQQSKEHDNIVWFKQFLNRIYIYGYIRVYDHVPDTEVDIFSPGASDNVADNAENN